MADIVRDCKDCKKKFTITEQHQKWFKAKGFSYPVRCEECRKKRKAMKQEEK